jgi:hypothetical protein
VLTLHGAQFKDAALIVASPPCQEFSYMAMPWTRAKAKAAAIRADTSGKMLTDLTALFDACFRIQAQASVAAGHRVPLIVENVRGAQPWVGRSRWAFGSYHLWGDVPALMPLARGKRMKSQASCAPRNWSERVASTPEEAAAFHYLLPDGVKHDGKGWRPNGTLISCNRMVPDHLKQGGTWWHDPESISVTTSSKSPTRKAASAMIAKIPYPLARHIGATFRPCAA